jgi:hypothetical protein
MIYRLFSSAYQAMSLQIKKTQRSESTQALVNFFTERKGIDQLTQQRRKRSRLVEALLPHVKQRAVPTKKELPLQRAGSRLSVTMKKVKMRKQVNQNLYPPYPLDTGAG